MVAEGTWRPARAVVDRGAITRNVARLHAAVSPAAVCAVVKANGYSHGAVVAANAALDGGAAGLAVALVDEGIELRDAGITAPILLLSEPAVASFPTCFEYSLTPTVATPEGVTAARLAAQAIGGKNPVHLKIDTGMHRVGASPSDAIALAMEIAASPVLVFEGCYTHFAVADGASADDRAFTEAQLDSFLGVIDELGRIGIEPTLLHAANTAAAMAFPRSRLSMVRCGIGIYGYEPTVAVAEVAAVAGVSRLEPAMAITAEVSAVHVLPSGARPSYGRRRALVEPSTVATVPLGYADGLPRRLFDAGFTVLIGGKRRPLAGAVTMDQIVVDCGDDAIKVGDEVVLLGRQGDEEVTVAEWADLLGTIHYEVLCSISARVPRQLA
ncbi:MAG: alanine racemase [Actinomycetota bacterium]